MIFTRKQSRFDFYLKSNIYINNDILIINIINKTNNFSKTIQVINIYNEKLLETDCNKYIVKRKLHEIMPDKNIILYDDLNIYHSW